MLSVGNTITVTIGRLISLISQMLSIPARRTNIKIEAETSLGRHIGTVTLDNLVAGGRVCDCAWWYDWKSLH